MAADLPTDGVPSDAASASGGFSILKLIGALAVAGIIVWFILANTQNARVTLWLGQVNMPLWIALLMIFLVGWGFGILFRWVRKRRKS